MVNVRLVTARFVIASALFILTALASVAEAKNCDRGAFGGYKQKNYKDTRAQVLLDRAVGDVAVVESNSGKIRVARGSWLDAFTGELLTDIPAEQIEIDHVIPVCWAWYRGAENWSYAKRKEFFNDETLLVVVANGHNRVKGSKGPDAFTPLKKDLACAYVTLFLSGVEKYALVMALQEAAKIHETRDLACGTEFAGN